ncbi:MAG: hypothetical protein HY583_02580, partial [Candidatus Omnitrophica bacterium]|nr:hypothetical protein [Candidatus Omnitrophota bacterium]
GPFTVDQKHNFEPSVSFEAYRDSNFTDSARYLASGALNQRRDYIDKPEFYDVRAQVKYDSFLSDDVYVHGGYSANYLRNDSVRSEVRPGQANPNTYVNPDVDNWRVSNVVSLGTALMNFLRKQGLDARFGLRGEHAYTNTHGILFAGGATGERGSRTQLNEGWVGEAASLTYKGLKNTTAFVGVDLEQKVLRWQETYDARSHESITVFNSGVPFPHYKTNIVYVDFVPKVKLTHRFNSKLKGNFIYKWQERERHYNPLSDNDPNYYPGFLGNQQRRVHDISSSVDVKLVQNWLSTLKYQYVTDNVEFEVGDQQQNLDRNRITVSLSGPVRDRIFTYFYGGYDYYRVDTPTYGPGTNRWSRGEEDYDFNGDVILVGTNINYQITKPVTLYLSYQLTDALGNDNNNTLNEAVAGLRFNLNKTTSVEARYQLFNFQDKRIVDGGYDDDYYGHGIAFGLKKALG